jgi:hypothetical protein
MHSDDLGLGVKSHSNSAMAGSRRNMPKYSLLLFYIRGKVRIRFAESNDYGIFSNSELVYCLEEESGTVRKVLF